MFLINFPDKLMLNYQVQRNILRSVLKYKSQTSISFLQCLLLIYKLVMSCYYPGMSPRQPVVDLVVAMVSIPLLIVFALMLETNMRGNWTEDPAARWSVLGLGIGLLFVSLMVCGYVTHRMGVCLWAHQQQQEQAARAQQTEPVNSVSSIVHLVASNELPPSYESAMGYDMPPPSYNTVAITMEKQKESSDTTG